MLYSHFIHIFVIFHVNYIYFRASSIRNLIADESLVEVDEGLRGRIHPDVLKPVLTYLESKGLDETSPVYQVRGDCLGIHFCICCIFCI